MMNITQANPFDNTQNVPFSPFPERMNSSRGQRLDEGAAQDAVPSSSQIREMVSEMQDQIDNMNISLQFNTYGEKDERVAVVITDRTTGEVIREIPPEEIQNLYKKMSEVAGLIFDRHA